MNIQHLNRHLIYFSVTLFLLVNAIFLPHLDWQGSATLHTVMETAATLLAFFVGILALIRYMSQQDAKFLYIGAGFIGTALLDAYHAIVTSAYFSPLMPSNYTQLVPWSWSASRLFLSVLMCVSWWLWFQNKNNPDFQAKPKRIFLVTAFATLGCFLVFTITPLPSISLKSAILHRPFELLPALFFLIALGGYLFKGLWRDDDFEHWLVLSLIVGFATQAIFMPFSEHVHDTEFNLAHLFKKASYILVLIGLFVSLYKTYVSLRIETRKRIQFEKELNATAAYTRSLIEASLDSLVTISADGKITDTNSATEQVTGISRAQLIGSDFSDYFTDPAKARTGYQQAFKQGSVTDYPLAIRHISGKITEVLYNANVYRGESGHVVGVFAAARDVTEKNVAENKLNLLSTAIEQSPTAVAITNLDVEIEYVNPCFTSQSGYTLNDVLGKNPRVLQSGLTEPSVYKSMWETLTQGKPWVGEFINRRKNGEIYYEEAHISPAKEMDGNISHYVAVKLDVTEHRQAQIALRESNEIMHSLLHSMAEGAYGVDTNGNCTFVNQAFLAMLSYDSADEIVGKHIHEVIHHSHADGNHYPASECRMYNAYKNNEKIHCADEVFWTKHGVAIPVEYWSQPIIADGVMIGAIATFIDITERKQAEDKVKQLAFYDALTKLPNRRLLSDRLDQVIAACQRNNFYAALMFLDLDNFKPLNDTHGHVAGDLLLIEAAGRLKDCIRKIDTVARFGGDEFVVMLGELNTDKTNSLLQAGIVAEKIRVALSTPYQLSITHDSTTEIVVQHRCTASIGIIVFNGSEGSQEDLMKCADAAMYEAKDAGRNQIRFHSE